MSTPAQDAAAEYSRHRDIQAHFMAGYAAAKLDSLREQRMMLQDIRRHVELVAKQDEEQE